MTQSERQGTRGPQDILRQRLRQRTRDRVTLGRRPHPDEPAPLSPAQERLWFVESLDPGRGFHHLPMTLRLRGELDEERLGRALGEIAGRHEALRTVLVSVQGLPAQTLIPAPGRPLRTVDVSGQSAAEVARRAARDIHAPFDLERGPLWRAVLYRLSGTDRVLAITLHHIIADAPSFAILASELQVLYAAFGAGQPSPLPGPAVGYPDFAVWQRARLSSPDLQPHSDYWTRQLAGAPQIVDLLGDKPRPAQRQRLGAILSVPIPDDVAAQVRSCARAEHATTFMTLLAAFGALLSRWCRQPDLLIGVPSTSRGRDQVQSMIGCFLNMVVIRVNVTDDPTFRAALGSVRRTVVEAFEHQDLPFEEVVRLLQPERATSHAPLFQVTFSSREVAGSPLSIPGVDVTDFDEAVRSQAAASVYDLAVDVVAERDSLTGIWAFNDELLDESSIRQLAACFTRLLRAATAEPDLPVSRLPMLDQEQLRVAVDEFNDTAAPAARECLPRLVAARAVARPDAVAVTGPSGSLTYRELVDGAAGLARRLQEAGVRPGDRVAVLASRSPATVRALLGVLIAGAAYVPLDPDHPEARLAALLADSGAKVLVAERKVQEQVRLPAPQVLAADDPGSPGGFCWPALRPCAAAYLMFTSGSTGRPKCVGVSHGNLVNLLTAVSERCGFGEDDTLLAVTTLSFDIASLELFLPLIAGGTVVLAQSEQARDGRVLADLIASTGTTMLQATPATWQLLRDAGWPGDTRLTALCGGEALPHALAAWLASRSRLWNVYGPTEATIWSTAARIEPGTENTGPAAIGGPLANTTVYVLDEQGRPVPVGAAGEICLGGSGVAALGYLGEPGKTASAFIPDPFGASPGYRLYRTGDLGRRRPDGTLQFLGRRDNQLKLRGYRIEPAEVERALTEHPAVSQAAVEVRDAAAGPQLVGYVVGADGADTAELRAHLGRTLPSYMVPAVIVRLDAMPLTPAGKVDRAALPLPGLRADDYVPPAAGAQTLIAGVWSDLLDVQGPGATEGFFRLGGHSLTVARLKFRLEEVFGVEPPLADLMTLTTIREQAALIERLIVEQLEVMTEDEAERLLSGEPGGDVPRQ